MPINSFTSQYERSFRKLVKQNKELRQEVKETLKRFAENPNHPSLRLEKLSGKDIWTIRINKHHRLFFIWSDRGDTAIFFLVGPHDLYRNV